MIMKIRLCLICLISVLLIANLNCEIYANDGSAGWRGPDRVDAICEKRVQAKLGYTRLRVGANKNFPYIEKVKIPNNIIVSVYAEVTDSENNKWDLISYINIDIDNNIELANELGFGDEEINELAKMTDEEKYKLVIDDIYYQTNRVEFAWANSGDLISIDKDDSKIEIEEREGNKNDNIEIEENTIPNKFEKDKSSNKSGVFEEKKTIFDIIKKFFGIE